jgi:hypothetical protein
MDGGELVERFWPDPMMPADLMADLRNVTACRAATFHS